MTKIKAVLDTNVIISAYFWKGAPNEVLGRGISKHFRICLSPAIIQETMDKLSRKFSAPTDDIEDLSYLLFEASETCTPSVRLRVVKDDPDDNKILECGMESRADYIVTGDSHLLKLKEYAGIKLASPKEFLKALKR